VGVVTTTETTTPHRRSHVRLRPRQPERPRWRQGWRLGRAWFETTIAHHARRNRIQSVWCDRRVCGGRNCRCRRDGRRQCRPQWAGSYKVPAGPGRPQTACVRGGAALKFASRNVCRWRLWVVRGWRFENSDIFQASKRDSDVAAPFGCCFL
jgi:hypothetical protein